MPFSAKQYYELNKQQLLERAGEKVQCEKCKSVVRRDKLQQHGRSKKCAVTSEFCKPEPVIGKGKKKPCTVTRIK